MRAFVIDGPREGSVREVPEPTPGTGQVVIAVDRVGVCGTDVEFFRGTQPYFATGGARYPLRIGHEWCGRVVRAGAGVDPAWLDARVTGDTMLGCQACPLCHSGRQHVCENRSEVGVLNGWHGALADELLMPVTAIHRLPASMSDGLGALVEPASLSLRCVETLGLAAGESLLVWGAGAIGLLATAFAVAAGVEVDVVGRSAGSLELARQLGAARVFSADEGGGLALVGAAAPSACYRGAIAASPVAAAPQHCLDRLQPGGHLVMVGISGDPSLLEARELIARDLTISALLSGSPTFARAIDLLASGAVDAEPLIGAVIGLDDLAAVLGGANLPDGARRGNGPKIQVAMR
ncbi:MAG: alcohol dehydrogenase catalytic domain-containing protein [Propionicimonas sp.]